jgi:hypothetical protein
LESGPFEKNSRLQCDRQVAMSRFHANTLSHFWRFHVDLVIDFLRLVSSVFFLWQIFGTWWVYFQKMKKSMKILPFAWRVFTIFWLGFFLN